MEYNQPSQIVKDLAFGESARDKVMVGVQKLTDAVKSTLGASGKCVIYEDAMGKPVITKDGVTVAESVVLYDPVENIGATLIKEAAKNTVREAGDGTTTATVLAHSLLNKANAKEAGNNARDIKSGMFKGLSKVNDYLDKISVPVEGDMLYNVAAISCNNDTTLGNLIADAFTKVGKDGVVLMEESDTNETYIDFVEGTQLKCGLKSPHLITDKDKGTAVLDNPYVLIVSSPIANIRKIQSVLEHVIKQKRSLLIVASVEQQPMAALLANKVKGNIKVNIIDLPGFGPTKQDTIEDLAFLTGAKVINEELGDDLDLIDPSVLGEAVKSITDETTTVLQTIDLGIEFNERLEQIDKKISEESNPYFKKRLQERAAMLNGAVGIVKIGADSKVELKEKKDRVEDAIYAVKAALQEGIVPGGGIALLNASQKIKPSGLGEEIVLDAIKAPFKTILENAGIEMEDFTGTAGKGIDVTSGKVINMVKAGIIDPVLVTKTALKNAVSVATTIFSADCVISNMRTNAGD
uniref:Chaperonin GroEL n=1 Tax=uncultured virus TaxID=340016 RepID=A0A240F789_9VIRU|nr:chaperonin GroEL [uncultured virus]